MSTLVERARWEGVRMEQLPAVADALGEHLPLEGVVAVHGAMGAGKTTLVRALLQAWGVGDDGASPTFGLVHHHTVHRQGASVEVRHFDLYRIEDEEEAERSGIAEMLGERGLSLVEWPERVPGLMPDNAHLLEASVAEDGSRTFILSSLRG